MNRAIRAIIGMLLGAMAVLSFNADAANELDLYLRCDNCSSQQYVIKAKSGALQNTSRRVYIMDAAKRQIIGYEVWIENEPGTSMTVAVSAAVPTDVQTVWQQDALKYFDAEKAFSAAGAQYPGSIDGRFDNFINVIGSYQGEGYASDWVESYTRNSSLGYALNNVVQKLFNMFNGIITNGTSIQLRVYAPDGSSREYFVKWVAVDENGFPVPEAEPIPNTTRDALGNPIPDTKLAWQQAQGQQIAILGGSQNLAQQVLDMAARLGIPIVRQSALPPPGYKQYRTICEWDGKTLSCRPASTN